MKHLRKPHWPDTFKSLLEREAPLPKCKHCGTSDSLTVDHIKPRSEGGTDDLDNLQFLCGPCNSRKGPRPDIYWSRRFYWDDLPSTEGLANLRAAQSNLLTEITTDPHRHFSRPLSEIARLLYICAWIVGAGKTIGIAVAAWALNFLILRERGKVRRTDRVLVICKEQAIRDQIAHDLAADLKTARIVPCAPKIGVVTSGDQFSQQEWLDQWDVVCVCIQQLWQKDESIRADIARILALFPLIAFDEPHWAHERVALLVEAAASSLCIGFTGTPIDSAGQLLKRMVGLSIYTYQDAARLDRSLKLLDADPALFPMFVRELDIHEANITRQGLPVVATDTNDPGYDQNIRPAEAVCGAVVQELLALDRLALQNEKPASHRGPDVTMDLIYWRHAIVYFDNIAAAEDAAATQNQKFDADRRTFPREQGWRVEVVHSGNGKAAPKPLAREDGKDPHPWMRAYRAGRRLDSRCARILYCVGMAREGVNNPLCGLTGVACSAESLLGPIQGWFGRPLRAVIEWVDGVLHVPPGPLDTVRLITHKAYDNIGTIQDAIEFLCNMGEHFEDLPGIEDLLDVESVPPQPPNPVSPALSRRDKIQILGWVKDREDDGIGPAIDSIVDFWGHGPGPRADRIRQWAKVCLSGDPLAVRKELRLDDDIAPIIVVRSERLRHDPGEEDLERFIRTHHPDLNDILPLNEGARKVAVKLYAEHAEKFQQPRLTATTSINALADEIGGIILYDLGGYFQGDKGRVFRLARTAMRIKFGIPREQTLANNSDWDTPETHALVRRPDIQNELIRWAIAKLIEAGSCPQLEAALSPARTKL